MTRILITGGNGFHGRALARALMQRGNEVIIFDTDTSSPIEGVVYIRGNILDFNQLRLETQGVDEVYHFGAVLGTSELLADPELAIDTNIKGTFNVLRVSEMLEIKKILYPAMPSVWLNMYSITKRAGENLCHIFKRYHHLDVRVLRWLNSYGPEQHLFPTRKVVPIFILQALNGLPLEIWGDGEQQIELSYIDDETRAVMACMRLNSYPAETFDAGTHHTCTVNELAQQIIDITQSRSNIVHLPMRSGEDRDIGVVPLPTLRERFKLDIHVTPLQEGLEKTVEYYNKIDTATIAQAINFYYGATPIDGKVLPMTKQARQKN